MRRLLAVALLATSVPLTLVSPSSAAQHSTSCSGRANWRMYGYDLHHTFDVAPGCSSINRSNVASLIPAWFFHAKDSITASVAVSHHTVYVGSWDGTFYAINAANGHLDWSYRIADHAGAAFGRIVSSAWVGHAGSGVHRRRVVVFGGGSNVWALNARTGRKLATINLDPRTKAYRKKTPDDVVEVESSPAVIPGSHGRRRIFIGMDVHDIEKVGQTGLVALTLRRHRHGWQLQPRWKYDPERDRVYRGRSGLTRGSGHGIGCGGVWSSPAIDPGRNLVVFGTANCDNAAIAYKRHLNYSEEMVAIRASGHKVWSFRPENTLPKAQRVPVAERDSDFGASPNLFRLADGKSVVGDGSKSARYYVRTMRSGSGVSNSFAGDAGYLQQNFAVGGFIGSSGVVRGPHGAGRQIIGGTAIPIPHGVTDVSKALWDVRSINPATGKVQWVYQLGAPSYGATSVVNGVAFVTETLQSDVVALNTASGLPLWIGPIVGPPSSTAVVAGDSLYIGTGTRETDLEYKAVSDQLENALKNSIGESPLSPLSGVQAFRLAKDALPR